MDVAQSSSGHPQEPGCVFCLTNGKLDVIRASRSGNTLFVQVKVGHGDDFVPASGAYFVLPTGHYKPDEYMPFDFLHEVNWHKRVSGLVFDNGGFNYTKAGGAKILDHAHYWLMQVQPGDEAMGLYTLREKVRTDQYHARRQRDGLDALELS